MAAERREYVGNAAATTLASDITSASTSIAGTAFTNWPTGSVGPFFIVLARGLSGEEKVKCSSRTGNTITVASSGRGADSTTAAAHSAGTTVEVCWTANDADLLNDHAATTTRDDHSQYILTAGTRAFSAVTSIAGSPGSSAVGDTVGAGTATTLARSDHRHGREGFATPGASAVGDSAAAGTATTVPHSDHVHAREGFGTPGSSAVGDSAAAGTATTVAHSDHVHGREAFATVVAVGAANAAGSATTIPHSDHVHAPPTSAVNTVATSESRTSATFGALTTAQAVTITTGTKVKVTLTALLTNNTAGGTSAMAYAISGATTTAVSDHTALTKSFSSATQDAVRMSAVFVETVTAGSNTFTAQFRSAGTDQATFADRTLLVELLG